MAGVWRQFTLLLWKNWLLQKRSPVLTLLELGLPCFFTLILIYARVKVESTFIQNATTWDAFAINQLPPTLCPQPKIFCPPWRMFYAPENNITKQVIGNLEEIKGISEWKGYPSEDAMVSDILANFQNVSDISESNVLGGLVFSLETVNKNFTYKLRLASTGRNGGGMSLFGGSGNWQTKLMFPQFQQVGPREKGDEYGGSPGYWREGFLTLQHAVDKSLAQQFAINNPPQVDVQLKRHPYPPYLNDLFVLVLQNQLPFIILVSFIVEALLITKDLVHEKERKLKESMKMMGLSNWLHWLAWFVKYFLFLLVSITIITVFVSIRIGSHGSILGFTDPTILLVFLLAYAVSTISFAFMVSVFFKKANSAAAASGIFFFMSYIPYSFLQLRYNTLSWGSKMAACLISNVAMPLGALVIAMFEGTGAGVQWSTINKGSSVDDDFTLLHVIIMLLVDSVIYLTITWYVEAVYPGEFGVPQPWYFPFMPSYWCGHSYDYSSHLDEEDTPLLRARVDFFEREPTEINAGIQIRNLTKEFGKGSSQKVAVSGMTLNMYEGQITALLGHNGAGKTTTMSMLTGFIPSTSGTARVNSFDIRRDIKRVRESLGLCPQHDVLFDNLTVREHLRFFVKLKGVPSSEVNHEVDVMLQAVDLMHKQHALAKTLSGGMKRKLSVAIALCGGSKVVILDEPTSGMDPAARRSLWDVLQRHRQGRTILLSTHFMDEADVLGDRIAIMSEGQVQCCGTPLFLKHKYGAGYHLVMVKTAECDPANVTGLVQSYVPAAEVESNVSAELSYILPHESKDRFEELFTQLDSRGEELGIASYGASVTTMEEVFLKVGEETMNLDMKEQLHQDVTINSTSLDSVPVFERATIKNTGFMLYFQQFKAMFIKRVLHSFRNLILAVSQLLVPLFFVAMALTVVKTIPKPADSPSLTLDMHNFETNWLVYKSSEGETETSLSKLYAKQFSKESYPGMNVINISDTKYSNLSTEDYLIMQSSRSIATYNNHYLVAAEIEEDINDDKIQSTAFFNDQAFHTPAISLNALSNAIVKYATDFVNASITTINHPLPRTVKEEIRDQLTQGFEGGAISFNMLFGMSFLASSFVVFLIKERSLKAKHIQFVSGVHSVTFWSSTFCWDLLNYLMPCLFMLVLFAAFGVEAYVDGGRIWYVLLLLLLYGWAVLPFMYVLSFIFTTPASGLVWLTMFNILSGIATVLAVDIMMIPQLNTTQIAEGLQWGFLTTLPNFCLGQGVMQIYNNHQFLNICLSDEIQMACKFNFSNPCCKGNCGDFCLDYNTDYLSWEEGGIGRFLAFLAIQGTLYFALLFLIESQLFQIFWYRVRDFATRGMSARPPGYDDMFVEDRDVAMEKERIATTPLWQLQETESLILKDVTKAYGPLLAVDSLSLGISQGECFGLLGINGAGKTSTFKMLTGDEMVSGGNAFVGKYDVRSDITMVQRQLGYCPQFDALIDQMTGRETLYMYARLRGVVEKMIPSVVTDLMQALLLEQYADVLVGSYSGGNKRKLSTAIALVGDPPIVFLDEPSTGMDPVARRLLWDTLAKLRQSGRTLVLTSHSMEECEALCTRLAVMVNGHFKCLGSIQHLKSTFGEGYTLIARTSNLQHTTNLQRLMEFINQTFPGAILKDLHQGMVHYHITDTQISLAQLFGKMEKAKDEYKIEDYLVSQTTLEQVFINFARAQVPPIESSVGCCAKMGMLCQFCWCGGFCFGCGGDNEEMRLLVDNSGRQTPESQDGSSGYQSVA